LGGYSAPEAPQLDLRGPTSKRKARVQGREGARMGKWKKGEKKGRERGKEGKKGARREGL